MSEEVQTPEAPAAEQTPNQPVTTETAPARIIGDDGTWNREYLDSLPEDLGKHSTFEKYKTFNDFVKGSINSQKLNGQKAEEFWQSEDPDHVAKRREIMGVPSDASEYQYDAVEFIEGMPTDLINERIGMAKEKFKELGLNKDQAKALLEWDLGDSVKQFQSQQDAMELQRTEAENTLRSEWKGEKFDYNIQKAKNALDYLGLGEWANDPAIGNNPGFIKDVFEKIVPLISDDTIIESRQTENVATLNDTYDAQWNKMATMDANDPSYNLEVAKMKQITEKMTNL